MKNKTTWIVVGIVLAIILLIGGLFISSNNKAIFLEEQINAAQADINVAEKRRYDLVFNLVDAVQSYQDYEGETMESIVSARNSMEHGDVEGAQMEITAVAEAYPELKANENYKQLMNELALTENQIAQYRNNYNEQVRSYNKMVRLTIFIVIYVSDAILQGAVSKSESYRTATVIENTDQFYYGMDTNFGNVLVYGDVSSNSSVTYDEIGGGFIYIEKNKEEYTRHTRTVTKTDSNGKKRTETEVYYTWDHVWSDRRHVEEIHGRTFPYESIELPAERLNLDSVGVDNRMNYIYVGSDDRYYYNVVPMPMTGTIYTSLQNGMINDSSALFRDMTPEQVIAHMEQNETIYTVVFWVIWVLLTCGAVCAFLYLENKWLD